MALSRGPIVTNAPIVDTIILSSDSRRHIAGHILSRIYNCTIHGNRPIDNATAAHLHCIFRLYNCTNCDQLHAKICPGSSQYSLRVAINADDNVSAMSKADKSAKYKTVPMIS